MPDKSTVATLRVDTETTSKAVAPLSTSPGEIEISVVIPVYNERGNLRRLFLQLHAVLEDLGLSYEVIFIDDGSSDGGGELLESLAGSYPGVKLMQFSRNFGQTAAIAAGFEHAQGRIIIPMDADLQNDPRDIPRLLERLEEGYDVVSCWRKDRKDPYLTRVMPSVLANRLISWIGGVPLHDYGCTLKAYRSSVVRHIRLYGEMHRFIPIYASWAGARVSEIVARHHPRRFGESKYGLSRVGKIVLDLITVKFLGSFATRPMYLFGGAGILSFLTGTALVAVAAYQKWFEAIRMHRNPLILIACLLLGVGIQFVLFGLLAELMVRVYHETRKEPPYIIRRIIGSADGNLDSRHPDRAEDREAG